MFLGIEIGGTKLQLGVGRGDGPPLVELKRLDVDPALGATGILDQIRQAAPGLIERHRVERMAVGFGGPVDSARGRVVRSHQVEGWSDFPLLNWCRETLGVPAVLGNDADLAGLAEARFGAGRGRNPVFYVTVGTGIGGGLVVDGETYRGHGRGAAEIGHLRPGLHADRPEETVESIASGWGLAAAAQAHLAGPISRRLGAFRAGAQPLKPEHVRQHLIEVEEAEEEYAADLWRRCDGDLERITARMLAEAAADNNLVALETLHHAWQVLGWGIAQAVTLLSPQVVVVGGGVALMGEKLLFEPLRAAANRYVFPPLVGTFDIVPARLGEEMVVHGALALARGKG
jgi:glucokinase